MPMILASPCTPIPGPIVWYLKIWDLVFGISTDLFVLIQVDNHFNIRPCVGDIKQESHRVIAVPLDFVGEGLTFPDAHHAIHRDSSMYRGHALLPNSAHITGSHLIVGKGLRV